MGCDKETKDAGGLFSVSLDCNAADTSNCRRICVGVMQAAFRHTQTCIGAHEKSHEEPSSNSGTESSRVANCTQVVSCKERPIMRLAALSGEGL